MSIRRTRWPKPTQTTIRALQHQKLVGFEAEIPTRRDNGGIAIVPKEAVTQEVEKGTVVALELEDAEFSRPLAAIYGKNKVLLPAMKVVSQPAAGGA